MSLVKPHAGTIFPNFSILRSVARTFRVWQPRGPGQTQIQAGVFVDKAAPDTVKEAFRLQAIRSFGPSGSFEQDDMDNWEGCSKAGRGFVARQYDLNIAMGLGHEKYDDDLNAWSSEYRISEMNHRSFYRRWDQIMSADTWPNS